MTMGELNALDRAAFVATVGWVFEDSPWVAERSWDKRPFADVASMHAVMTQQVRDATRDEQLALLRAHPDLGARARMTVASASEQTGVGLDRLPADQYARLQSANAYYRERFGFPFLFSVRGSTPAEILDALHERLGRSWEEEFDTALEQVFRIASARLRDLIQHE